MARPAPVRAASPRPLGRRARRKDGPPGERSGVEITTFWVQGHGLREFVGAADPRSPRHRALEDEAVGMAATIGGAWTTVVVDVPEDDIVDAFARTRPVT